MTRGVRRALAAAAVLGQASLVACGLDFDRFDPTDASSESSTAQPPPATGPDASTPDTTQMPPPATGPDASGPDATKDRVPARDASCTPPASCFTRAQTCNTQCSDQRTQCLSNCGNGGCMHRCDATEQTCTSQCATQCTICSYLGGCAAQNDCFDAAGGG